MSKQVLVIEDNQDVRENLCEILELAGYETRSAENGKKGLVAIYDRLPDIILCDVMMPELDGYGVLKILRSNPKYKNIPFLFLTARTEQADFRKGMMLGADDYITKPFDESDLLEALTMRLGISTSRTEHNLLGRHDIDKLAFATRITKLIDKDEARNYKEQSHIITENQIIRQVGILQSGVARRVITDWEGRELTTELLSQHDIIGWEPLMHGTDKHSPYSIISVTDCKILFIEESAFMTATNSDVTLKNYLLKLALDTSSHGTQALLNVAYMNVRQKVAYALLTCSQHEGCLGMKREEMATLVGIAKESFSRCLSEFKADGIITIDNHTISILEPKELELICHF